MPSASKCVVKVAVVLGACVGSVAFGGVAAYDPERASTASTLCVVLDEAIHGVSDQP